MKQSEISQLRHQLDQIDQKIISLLRRRLKIATKIQKIKRQLGLGIFDPAREELIIQRLKRKYPRQLSPNAVEAIFREILSASRSGEKTIRVAFPRPEYGSTHQAALQIFGRSSRFLACSGKTGVYQALKSGKADYGIVPTSKSKASRKPGIRTLRAISLKNGRISQKFLLIESPPPPPILYP